MPKPLLLDLYCGAGGASKGYHDAGFDVIGIDLHPQPNYPYDFIRGDAVIIGRHLLSGGTFDAIHASPPCQAYSTLRHASKETHSYADLIPATRDLLIASGLPYVIENVVGAPLVDPVKLCGSMFELGSGIRQLRRHRLFESSFHLGQPSCRHEGQAIGVYGGGPSDRTNQTGRGGYQGTVAEKREAMGIDWMTAKELNQAIPPAYTEFIGAFLKMHIKEEAYNA